MSYPGDLFASWRSEVRPASARSVSPFDAVFGAGPVLLPVIHPISRTAALTAIDVAREAGVRGVFLIDQGLTEREVLQLVVTVRARHPALWIGVNLLSRTSADALSTVLAACGTIGGIWSDDAGVDERPSVRPRAHAFAAVRRSARWTGLYFGGVAFKYQRPIADDDLRRVARAAADHMDVICTSGPGTGYPADVSKVQAMRAGLDDRYTQALVSGGLPGVTPGQPIYARPAMALASGVTADNVQTYLPHVQAFLVGTGIESRLGVLDPGKIVALLQALRPRAA